jgi:ABC-2 type transport system permease protein
MLRHLRLMFCFAKFSLLGELAFRSNFLLKILVELIWLGILLTFFKTIFGKSSNVAGWNEHEFLFFVGAYYALEGFVETFFLENCVEFSELVRSGNLDFCLLKPIDPQFFITLRRVDWSTAPKILLGFIMISFAMYEIGKPLELWKVPLFLILFLCGCSLAYSFLLLLTSLSVWMIRNQSLMEVWWLFTNLMRYPRQIYDSEWALPIRMVFGFIIPALLAVSIPVEFAVKEINIEFTLFLFVIAIVYFQLSRMFFNYSLKYYRSASS